MIKQKEFEKITPGNILSLILSQFEIKEEELIKYALVSKDTLHYIIHGNNLIPCSIALYLVDKTGILPYFWQTINDNFCKIKNIKYVGSDLGYEVLLNKIMFEKEEK